VFQQRRGRGESRGDGLDGGEGLRGGGVQAGVVLEGEEGAEAVGEGDGFGGEGFAEGEEFLVFEGEGWGFCGGCCC